MIVLVAVGVMNVAVMAALAVVIFAEKLWRYGKPFGQAVGVVPCTASPRPAQDAPAKVGGATAGHPECSICPGLRVILPQPRADQNGGDARLI
jgi:hypothetical protein